MINYYVKINNVDVSAYIRNDISAIPFIDTNDDYSLRNTRLDIDVDSSLTPTIGQSVEILREAVTIFSGYIHNIQRDRVAGLYNLECYSLIFKLNQHTFDPELIKVYLADLVAGTTKTATSFDDGYMACASHGLTVGDVIILYTADFNECIPYYYYVVKEVGDGWFKFTISTLLGYVMPETGRDYDFAKVTATSGFVPCVYSLNYNNISLSQVLTYIFSLVGATLDITAFTTSTFNGITLDKIGFDDRMLMMVNQSSTRRQEYDTDNSAWQTSPDIQNSYLTCFELLSEILCNMKLQIYPTSLNTYKVENLIDSYVKTTRWGLSELSELPRGGDIVGNVLDRILYPRFGFDSRFKPVTSDYPFGFYKEYDHVFTISYNNQSSYNNLVYLDMTTIADDYYGGGYEGLLFIPSIQLASKIDDITKSKYRETNVIPVDLTAKACLNCYIEQDLNYDTMKVEEVTYT